MPNEYILKTCRTLHVRRLLLLAALNLFLGVPAWPQEYKPSEAARKDGKVIVYGSLEDEQFTRIKNNFEKRTGITLDYWRASNAKILDRAITEHRARKPHFDVILNNEDPMQIMLQEGILAKFDSPTIKKFFQGRDFTLSWALGITMSLSALFTTPKPSSPRKPRDRSMIW